MSVGRANRADGCPLSGVKRTSMLIPTMPVPDPKRTLPIGELRLGSLAHKHTRHRAGYECESGNCVDRGGKTKRVRDQTCGERADCVTKVTPKAVDTKGARAPCRVRCVGHCGDQSWIDHRGSKS